MANSIAPWINYQLRQTKNASSNPAMLAFQASNTLILDSLNIANTTSYNAFIDVVVWRPYIMIHLNSSQVETSREIIYDNVYLVRHMPLSPFAREKVMKEDSIYLNPGDYLTAQSDYFKNQFDGLLSYRELIPGTPSTLTVTVTSKVRNSDSSITVTATASSDISALNQTAILITGISPAAYNGVYILNYNSSDPNTKFSFVIGIEQAMNINDSTTITGSVTLLPLSLSNWAVTG